MNIDFFLGKREKRVAKAAKTLGFEQLYFIEEVSALNEIKKETAYDAVLIKTSNIQLLRRMADKASAFFKLIFVLGTTDAINRAALEHKAVSGLVAPEYNRPYDYMHYRSSGLNQVLCKIARDSGKVIIINFKDILSKSGKERAVLVGRIEQNIKLCRKYKARLKLASFASSVRELRSSFELRALCRTLGMTPSEAKEALSL